MGELTIRTAVEIIAKHDVILSHGAKLALESEENLNCFVNEIREQFNESQTNQLHLYDVFGKRVINAIIF